MMYIELANDVAEGRANALDAYIALKKAEQEVQNALWLTKDYALKEALKYGEKSFSAFGAKIEIKNSPATYKFCGAITDLEERLKAIKDMAKSGSFADPETGELIDQAIKIDGKQTLSISLK